MKNQRYFHVMAWYLIYRHYEKKVYKLLFVGGSIVAQYLHSSFGVVKKKLEWQANRRKSY
jgi:hypothetical protein